MNMFNEDLNEVDLKLSHFYIGENLFVPVENISVKQLQITLKVALSKTTMVDYESKLDINNFNRNTIYTVRKKVKNCKLRNIFYRLINKDFFSKERLKRIKLTDNDLCDRCNLTETTKHLLWECSYSKNIWELYNHILVQVGENKYEIKIFPKYVLTFNCNCNNIVLLTTKESLCKNTVSVKYSDINTN